MDSQPIDAKQNHRPSSITTTHSDGEARPQNAAAKSPGSATAPALASTMLPDPILRPGIGSSPKILGNTSSILNPEIITPSKDTHSMATVSTDMSLRDDLFRLEKHTTSQISQLSGTLHDLKLDIAKLQAAQQGKEASSNLSVALATSAAPTKSPTEQDQSGKKNSSSSAQKAPAGTSGQGEEASYMPFYISNLPAFTPSRPEGQPLPIGAMHAFTKQFLQSILGDEDWNCGFYYPTRYGQARQDPEKREARYEGNTSMKQGAYYLLDPTNDPFVPKKPGAHGARIGVFFRLFELDNEEAIYQDVPAFVRVWPSFLDRDEQGTPAETGHEYYAYLGSYSQSRWSDKLDYDRMCKDVPYRLLEYWARRLCVAGDRPRWMTEALKEAITPKPEYEGPVTADDTDEAAMKQFRDVVTEYMHELCEWDAEATAKVNSLSPGEMLSRFADPDIDGPPGLRLQWEYLECVGFDYAFYRLLMENLHESGKTSAVEQQNAAAGDPVDSFGAMGAGVAAGAQATGGTEIQEKAWW